MTDFDTFDIKEFISTKKIVRLVVGVSVRFVIATAITQLVPADSRTQKVKLIIGSYVIASIVADKAQDYIDGEYDDLSETLSDLKSETNVTPTVPNP